MNLAPRAGLPAVPPPVAAVPQYRYLGLVVEIYNSDFEISAALRNDAPDQDPELSQEGFWLSFLSRIDPKSNQEKIDDIFHRMVPAALKSPNDPDLLMEFLDASFRCSCYCDEYWSTRAMCQLTLERNPESLFFMPKDKQGQWPELVCNNLPHLLNLIFRQMCMKESAGYLEDMEDTIRLEVPKILAAWIESGFPPPLGYLSDPAEERDRFERCATYCLFPDILNQSLHDYNKSVEEREKAYRELPHPRPHPPPHPMTDDVKYMTSIVLLGRPELSDCASETVQGMQSFNSAAVSAKARSGCPVHLLARHPELLENLRQEEVLWDYIDGEFSPRFCGEPGIVKLIGEFLGRPDEEQRKRNRNAVDNFEYELGFTPAAATRSVRRRS